MFPPFFPLVSAAFRLFAPWREPGALARACATGMCDCMGDEAVALGSEIKARKGKKRGKGISASWHRERQPWSVGEKGLVACVPREVELWMNPAPESRPRSHIAKGLGSAAENRLTARHNSQCCQRCGFVCFREWGPKLPFLQEAYLHSRVRFSPHLSLMLFPLCHKSS